MTHKGLSRWLWLAVSRLAVALSALLLAALLPAQVAWAHGPSDGGADRGDINGLFTIIFWMSVPVFLLVEGLILFAIIRYRRRHKDEQPEQIAGSRRLELAWTDFIVCNHRGDFCVHLSLHDDRVRGGSR